MLKDLLIAADQVLFNFQVAKARPGQFPQQVNLSERKPS
jgi:hypothetical protein